MNPRHTLLRVLVLLALCLGWSAPGWATAARVVFVTGQAWITDTAGERRAVRLGGKVAAGETVATGQAGRVQLRFTDGGHMGLIPHSSMRVDEYEYAGRPDGSEKGLFSLLRGGLRAVTGAIGRVRKQAYQLNTPVATIGIRGTSFRARFCSGDCAAPDGLYVQGGTGTVFVRNAFGEIDVRGGAAAYVADLETPPAPTSQEPEVSAPAPETAPEIAAGAAEPSDSGSFDTTRLNPVGGGSNVVRVVSLSSGDRLGGAFAADDIPNSLSDGGVLAGGAASTMGSLDSGETVTAGFDQNDALVLLGVAVPADPEFVGGTGLITTTNVADAGNDGILYWGRWTQADVHLEVVTNSGVFLSEDVTLSGNKSIHYMVATSAPTLPGAGTATYTLSAATPSTSDSGSLGAGLTSGALTANFGASNVGVNMSVSHGGTYTVTGNAPIKTNSGRFNDTPLGSVTANGPGCTGCNANVAGFFAGAGANAPSRAGLAYGINRAGGDGIHGVGGFTCTSGC